MSVARDTADSSRLLGAQPDDLSTDPPLLAMQGIVKRYGPTLALNGVDFAVRAGEIHALLGENGAGKSTLMHVLSGLTHPDSGTIRLAGRVVRVPSPRAARALGIAMVHQHFALVPAFTVAENLALDAPCQNFGLRASGVRGFAAKQAAAPALQRAAALGWPFDPDARISDLSVGAQQRVEIVKALATEARLLIFDEPTAVLAGGEVEELFSVLRRLRDEGNAVILIAHKLAEILAVADHVTVLRRGHRVASCQVSETDARQLAAWMIGEAGGPHPRPLPQEQGRGDALLSGLPQGSPALWEREEPGSNSEASGYGGEPAGHGKQRPYAPNALRTEKQEPTVPPPLFLGEGLGVGALRGNSVFVATEIVVQGDRGEEAIRGLSLEVRGGEIFGIGGVDGNGQTELAEALVGLRPVVSGTLTWNGGPFRAGRAPTTGYIPQDRRRVGLAVTMTVEDNLLFEAVRSPEFRRGPFLKRKALRRLATDLIRTFDIRTSGAGLPVSALSGGNQQKVVVARALYAQPEWIVAVNPTRGLDIGATRFVHTQLRQARARGAAIVLISTDLDELAALADRAAILAGGHLTEYRIEQADRTQLGLLLGGLGSEGKTKGEDAT
jgi:simple sugar transport system ATP-binding protein